jgi:hypothetical protein
MVQVLASTVSPNAILNYLLCHTIYLLCFQNSTYRLTLALFAGRGNYSPQLFNESLLQAERSQLYLELTSIHIVPAAVVF